MEEEFKIYKSNRKGKKYMAVFKDEKRKPIHFGQLGYQHYLDSTPLKLYTNLNHLDEKRRYLFKKRFEKSRHKKYSASWFSDQFLW
jgi:hypothetical protein